jgi:hypothetical protein
MAEIAKSGIPSPCSILPDGNDRVSGDLFAGEQINPGDACYINTDGKVYRSIGTTAGTLAAKVRGWAAGSAKPGQAITLYFVLTFRYGAALTPGTSYYLSGTNPAGLADAASIGGTGEIAFAVDTTRIRVKTSAY